MGFDKRKLIIPLTSCIPILACVYAFSLGPSPYRVLFDFQSEPKTVAQDLFEAPRVDRSTLLPVLVYEVQKKNAPRRVALIKYLGRSEVRSALPTLERILKDKSESEQVRGVALRSIFEIDQRLGKKKARDYQERGDTLGQVAQVIVAQ